jgi:hypothetical protein
MSAPINSRAEAKVRALERDEERLRRGEITPQELPKENLVVRRFRKDVIGLKPKDLPKDVNFVFVDPKT